MTDYTFKIECEEDGFYLVVEVPNFSELELVRYKIADPEALYTTVKAEIGPWLYERDQARLAFLCVPDESGGRASTGEWTGIEVDDPKHPDWHSVHADIWDAREGK